MTGSVERAVALVDKVIEYLEGRIPLFGVAEGEPVRPQFSWAVPPGVSDIEPGGGIMVLDFEEGLRFGEHVHPYCTELLMVINGKLTLDVFREDAQLPYASLSMGPGMYYLLTPGERHDVKAEIKTTVLAVTVPRDGGFSDVCFGVPWRRDASTASAGDAGRDSGVGPEDDEAGRRLWPHGSGPCSMPFGA